MSTDSQITANRANAQLSTGPSSPEGKLKSSHNALKTGLTGRTIVLPTDDVAAYQKLVAAMHQKFYPVDDYDCHLVQTIADTEWRLLRIPTIEAGYYALGRHELAAECAHESDPQVRASLLEALIARAYKKDFHNLAIQERRLRNQLKACIAELHQLQDEQEAVQFQRRNEAMFTALGRFNEFKPPANSVEHFGFEFTGAYLKTRYQAHSVTGQDAVREFDRSWKAQWLKKAAQKAGKTTEETKSGPAQLADAA
jgi:hypothetical protein